MGNTIRVEGIPQLQTALLAASAGARQAAVSAIEAEVRAVTSDARGAAPRRTGALVGGISGSSSGTTGEVRSSTRHSVFMEFGTSKDAAQPFMGPAAEKSRRRFPAAVAARVRAVLGRGR